MFRHARIVHSQVPSAYFSHGGPCAELVVISIADCIVSADMVDALSKQRTLQRVRF